MARLASGEKLGAYEIVGPLGAGGMGEVYRARDTKLDRDVAIKVLPEAFATDSERVARFDREAKLLAALNHPGIATLHGLEEANGTRFLVMELVEGETLADRVSRGAIPHQEALPLFHQISEALEAAHEKGVVHRDLKPANLKVTPEGKVKILDFGLAKLVEAEPKSTEASGSQSPTIARGTLLGAIMGTASYMSPEQARGGQVDRRTDIWAFGCCLYEALTGKKAFDGESVTDALAAVVKSEPDWSRLPKEIPWRIRDLLGRCLRKDPAKRLRDISAARLDIEDGSAATSVAESRRLERSRALVPGLVLALLAGLLIGAALWRRTPATRPHVQRFAVQIPVDFSRFHTVSVSPDGSALAFVGRGGQLGIRRFEDLEARFIEGTINVRYPFFSPDGRWVGFFAGGELKKVPLSGGPPVTLARIGTPSLATWSVNGSIYILDTYERRLRRVPDSGGTSEVVSEDLGSILRFPQALPDGRSLLATSFSAGSGGTNVELISVTTGERKTLVAGSMPRYVSTGQIVFGRAGALFAVPFDLDRLEITGEPVPVVEAVHASALASVDYDVSPSGTLVYLPSTGGLSRLVWVDRNGKVTPLAVSDPGWQFFSGPRLSPDGRRVAVTRTGAGGADVCVLDIARGTLSRITFEGLNTGPLWSPDGKEVFLASGPDPAKYAIFSAPVDGRGALRQRTTGAYRVPTSISSDGRIVLFRQLGEGWDVGMIRLGGKSEPELLLASRFNEHTGMLSPDDRWLAYVSDESGRDEVYVTSFPDLGRREQVSTEGGREPLWSRDGKELYYRNGDKLLAVSVKANPVLLIGRPAVLFSGRYGSVDSASANYDVAADGRFLILDNASGGTPTTVNVILNWFEELRRLSPK